MTFPKKYISINKAEGRRFVVEFTGIAEGIVIWAEEGSSYRVNRYIDNWVHCTNTCYWKALDDIKIKYNKDIKCVKS